MALREPCAGHRISTTRTASQVLPFAGSVVYQVSQQVFACARRGCLLSSAGFFLLRPKQGSVTRTGRRQFALYKCNTAQGNMLRRDDGQTEGPVHAARRAPHVCERHVRAKRRAITRESSIFACGDDTRPQRRDHPGPVFNLQRKDPRLALVGERRHGTGDYAARHRMTRGGSFHGVAVPRGTIGFPHKQQSHVNVFRRHPSQMRHSC